MTHATIHGIRIAFDDIGDGRNVLLLVHGHPFNRSMWKPQMTAFAGWRVIAPDLRGYGETTVVPGRTTLDVFAGDLAGLLDHLGIGGVVIGGLSMGGQIAMEFCRGHGERVRGLLLAATFPQADTDDAKRKRNAAADRLLREGMGPYAVEVLPKMVGPRSLTALPEVGDHVLTMMRATNPEGAAAALRGRAERPDYKATLAALAVPALVVVGSDDAFTSRADAERMRDLLKHGALAWLDGVGHMPNLENAAAFNQAAAQLLERVASRAP